ncbi:hypothetical protein KY326_03030 [Candidatus Woesearchaeota archaeon]|nr:hypothetical protein [Candidatus Woesearchaeota archaeon]
MAKTLANISLETVKHIIREYLRKGHDIQFIRSSLLKAGVPKAKLDQAQREIAPRKAPPKPPKMKARKPFFAKKAPKAPLKQPKPVKRAPPKPFMQPKAYKPKGPSSLFWKAFIPLIIVAILIISLIVVFTGGPMDCKTDERCFLELANACKAGQYQNTIDTTTIKYITKNCQLTKEIIGLSPDEPAEVKDLFMGLAMTCNYQQNMFSRAYIDEISGDLETCTGPLATVIRELRR